jgi:tetratricopeptide (TPR) repeat protein
MVSEFESHLENGKHLLFQLQDPAAAIDEFSRALSVDPSSVVAFVYRHFAYVDLKMWVKAIADLNQAIRLCPDDYRLYSYRADVKVESRDYESAYDDLCEAMTLDGSLDLLWRRGYVALKLRRDDQAVDDYSEIIAMCPEDACARNNRGLAYLNKGLIQEALNDFNRAIELNADHPDHHNSRARLFEQLGDRDKAIFDSEAALETCDRVFDPSLSDDVVWNDRAEALVRLGRYQEAIETSKNVLRIRADDPEPYRFIADALAGLEQYDEALKNYDKSIELDRDPEVVTRRTRLLEKLQKA